MIKKVLYLFLISGLSFSLTACQKDVLENIPDESESKQQIEEITQIEEIQIESSVHIEEITQTEEVETESTNQSEESSEIVQNDYFSVVFDSVTENEVFYIINFIFTNVSDISYYKGDELYHPGESWEKNCKISKNKLKDYCKNSNYIHYKLYNLSVYNPDTQELYAGGARFDMNEELEIYNLEIFDDVPIEKN